MLNCPPPPQLNILTNVFNMSTLETLGMVEKSESRPGEDTLLLPVIVAVVM